MKATKIIFFMKGIWNYCWYLVVFNPLVFPLLTLFAAEKMFKFANRSLHLGGYEDDMMWSFVRWYGKRCHGKRSYWFHFATKLKYSGNKNIECEDYVVEKFVVTNTKSEKDFEELYDHDNISNYTKSRYIWCNEILSPAFRLMMIKKGYTPSLTDFTYVLETNQIEVVHYIARQTLSDQFVVEFWEYAQVNDNREILLEFIDYVLREGLTPRGTSFVMQSQQSVSQTAVRKALEVNSEVAFVKRSRPNEIFRESLIKGRKFYYEAECVLTPDLYRIFKQCNYELSERAVMYHLDKKGDMARIILNENREFSIDALKMIMASKTLKSWYRTRI